MKLKNIVIFLIVIILAGGGLYLIQKDRQKKDLIAHHKKKFENLKNGAQKSGAAGLLEMARTINKFHQDTGRYPEKLLELYPMYIPDREFITSLNWEYTPGKDTYVIKKSAESENIFAAMGPDLRLKTGATGMPSLQKIVSVSKQPAQEKKSAALIALKSIPSVKKDMTALKQVASHLPLKDLKKIEDTGSVGTHKKTSEPVSQVQIVKKELGQNEKFLLSLENSGLYIWKTKDGFIGFSDIQYPDKKKVIIFKDKNWIEYVAGKHNADK